jgi:dephospho-CoA kinase
MTYLIGLTGNIGVGKSTVMQILRELGADTIDADRVAHEVIQPGGKAYLKVINAFGHAIVQNDGLLDRKQLGAIVFNDPERLQLLESLVHPAVEEKLLERLQTTTAAVAVVEAIKLIEAGLTKFCREVWVVTSPQATQLARLAQTRGMSRAEAERRISAQSPHTEKIKHAQVVIENVGSLETLRKKVEAEWARVQQQLKAQA